MNSFLLNRAQGSISPNCFHVAQTSRLVQLIEPAPNIHFTSSQHVSSPRDTTEVDSSEHTPVSASVHDIYAHRSGVNVLALDPNEGR
jgi:DNA excision repair protein ERCC-8